ncbi:MAG: hypothetical protein Q9174_003707 [Haloplaca sp. 1 TL-2023]
MAPNPLSIAVSTLLSQLSNAIWRARTGRVRLLSPITRLNEEPIEWYRPGRLHPVKLGDLFNNRYEIVRKLGWGVNSTVWLAKDKSAKQHVALKIISAGCHGYFHESGHWHAKTHTFELEILQSIASTKSDHPGRKHIPQLLNHFKHVGPHGNHECLVLPLKGRSLYYYAAQWDPSRIPTPIMRRITRQLLSALDFLHNDCGIVYTDLKQANILLDLNGPRLEHEQRELCVQEELWHVPTATGIAYPDFDYVRSDYLLSSLSDVETINIQLADLGSACWKDRHIHEIIQPPLIRAPEVDLGLPWDEKVDIWTVGHLVYESLTARRMFGGITPKDTLTQISLLLEPFPKGLRERVKGATAIFTSGEKALQGSPERPEYESPLSHEERKDFLDFVRLALTLDPRERPSAKELLDHPWLHKEYECPKYESF